MSDRYDKDRIRQEHIRMEQQREERRRTEASQKKRREIEDGFRRLGDAGKKVERLRSDNPYHKAMQNVRECETDIRQLLAELITLPDEPEKNLLLFFPYSNAIIRRKARVWDGRFNEIRKIGETDAWTAVRRSEALRNEVEKFRNPPHSLGGFTLFKDRLSDAASMLLSKLRTKLLWLDQYYLELENEMQKRAHNRP